jgi:hypothetical protein
MKRQCVIFVLYAVLSTVMAFAQAPGQPSDAQTCAACGTCGAGAGTIIIIPVIFFALNIALLVWVARDAKARGMDSSVLWMILVMFTSVVGLIIYVFARPQGELESCSSCGNNRLKGIAKCPYCGNP